MLTNVYRRARENRTTTIVDGNKTGPVILVAANGVDLAEFTIRTGQDSHPRALANGFAGVNFHLCSFNNVTENLIIRNSVGIRLLDGANNNTIHHNNFVNNTIRMYVQSSYSNTWDNGYPSGGNYWSDYNGSDCHNGPDQNLAGCDGFGDTPNVFSSTNRDNYPIMKLIPWSSDDIGATCMGKVGSQGVSPMKTVIAEGTTVHFSVFVMNYGNDTETLNVTTYVNATSLGTQTGITISSRGYAIVNFTWNTSSFERGSYIISAQITAVPDENDTDDNSLKCPVTIGIVGDVDNNGIVNMLDIYSIALRFGAIAGQTGYISNYDIDDNGIINMLDLYVAAVNFGASI